MKFIDRNGEVLNFETVVSKAISRLKKIALEFDIFFLRLVGYIPSHIARRLFFTLAGIKMGSHSTIHTGSIFHNPCNISIGDGTIIGENAVLDGRDKLIIGSHVDIASQVMIYNAHHDIYSGTFEHVQKPVAIEDYVFIGPRAIILPGVTIKKGAVVAAGAVVTKDVEERSIVAGIPAKEISKREVKELNYKLGRFELFR